MQLPVVIQQPNYLRNFVASTTPDDLTANVGGGFPVISFRGRVWRIIVGGENTPVMDGTGQPVPSIEVVLVKGNPKISKIFYKAAYIEGSDDPPDCFSNDGDFPDPSIPVPQCDNCAMCPQNVWGSKITPQGTKVKACSDSRRVAVVAGGEIAQGTNGIGPMLLRVPPASLELLRAFGDALNNRGIPYNDVITRIGFDLNASYPKLVFSPVRVLTEEEFVRVQKMVADERIGRILGGLGITEYTKPAAPAPAPVAAAPAPAPAPVAPAPVAAAPAPAPAPARRRRAAAAPEPAPVNVPATVPGQPPAPSVQMPLFGTGGGQPMPTHPTPPAVPGMAPPPNLDVSAIVSSALQGLDDRK